MAVRAIHPATACSPMRCGVANLRGGFTLIELLVVIGIIALLLGILLPVAFKALGAGEKARLAADLQAISTALDAYRDDFGDIPRPAANEEGTGFAVLAKALVGPGPEVVRQTNGTYVSGATPPAYDAAEGYAPGAMVESGGTWYVCVRSAGAGVAPDGTGSYWRPFDWDDGADGLGTRNTFTIDGGNVVARGNIQPPYLVADRFGVTGLALIDAQDSPILYFTGNPRPGPSVGATNFADDNDYARYDLAQNIASFLRGAETLPGDRTLAIQRAKAALGDFDVDGGLNPGTAVGEPAVKDKAFLLWSAGPDGEFGVDEASTDASVNRAQVTGEPDSSGETYTPLDDVISISE